MHIRMFLLQAQVFEVTKSPRRQRRKTFSSIFNRKESFAVTQPKKKLSETVAPSGKVSLLQFLPSVPYRLRFNSSCNIRSVTLISNDSLLMELRSFHCFFIEVLHNILTVCFMWLRAFVTGKINQAVIKANRFLRIVPMAQ